MARTEAAVELRGALGRGLVERLAEAGWREVDPSNGTFSLVGLIRPLAGGFAATAEVTVGSTIPDDPPVRVAGVRVGVAYEPLRRWWPLLGDQFELSLLAVSAGRLDGTDDVDSEVLLEFSALREVAAAVEVLASSIVSHAVPYAERYASDEALLAAVSPVSGARTDLRLPALLAALGRFDEAAVALARYQPPDESRSSSRRQRRTAYQLRRWVDGRGDESLLPDAPPPSALEDRSRPRSFREIGAGERARREAVEWVREAGRGRHRDEVRAMLERELTQRGVNESPIGLEQTLDHLWDTPAERVHTGVQGLKVLGRFGLGVARAIRDRELPDLSNPQRLEPPEPAFYELPRGDQWRRVSLERGMDDRLEHIHQAARPHILGVVSLTAWLQPEPNSPDIVVYIGQERVGVLSADDDDAAAARLLAEHAVSGLPRRAPGARRPPGAQNPTADLPA